MANVTKLSNEELEELKSIQSKYLELTAQLGQVNLEFLGAIIESDAFYQIAYKYIRNVSLFDVSVIKNNFTEKENREHFILLHS